MQAGDLDRRVVLEYKSVSQDADFGTEVITWLPLDGYEDGSPTTAKTCAAMIQDHTQARAEGVRQSLVLARNPSRMVIRYRTGVTSAMRVREPSYGDQIYQIIAGPTMLGRREWLEFTIERYSTTGAT